MNKRKVQKIGNSYMVSIPKEVVKKLNIKSGDKFDFMLKEGTSLSYETKTELKPWSEYTGNINIPNFDMEEVLKDLKGRRFDEKFNKLLKQKP